MSMLKKMIEKKANELEIKPIIENHQNQLQNFEKNINLIFSDFEQVHKAISKFNKNILEL
jgi:hypothetical protein